MKIEYKARSIVCVFGKSCTADIVGSCTIVIEASEAGETDRESVVGAQSAGLLWALGRGIAAFTLQTMVAAGKQIGNIKLYTLQ